MYTHTHTCGYCSALALQRPRDARTPGTRKKSALKFGTDDVEGKKPVKK